MAEFSVNTGFSGKRGVCNILKLVGVLNVVDIFSLPGRKPSHKTYGSSTRKKLKRFEVDKVL